MPRHPVRHALGVAAAATLAVALHGYHAGASDQKLYVPAALRLVEPALYPHDAAFFATEARFTLFDDLLATALRAGAPLDVALFAGQLAAIGLLLAAGRRLLARAGLPSPAQWAGVLTLAIALPVPVAGTRVGVLEPYLHPRGLGIAVAAWAFVFAVERRSLAVPCLAVAGALHPLTGLWSAGHLLAQAWPRQMPRGPVVAGIVAAAAGVIACRPAPGPPLDEASFWRTALTPEVFGVRYPLHWPWYEWAGVVAPLLVLGAIAADRTLPEDARRVTRRLAISAASGVVLAVLLTIAPSREWPLQPMRQLHLVYAVTLLLAGAWCELRVMRGRPGRRAVLGFALSATVVLLHTPYPDSPHVEWPGRLPDNAYVRAFDWIRTHTAVDTRIAVDPFYLRRPGPDWHSARVFTRRSMLSDAVHDLSPAAMTPGLAERWLREQQALAGWPAFTRADFARLAREFEVSWLVVAAGQAPELDCPFAEPTVRVCRAP